MAACRAYLWLIVLMLAATCLTAQQNEKRTVSLTVEPSHITLMAGQTQRLAVHMQGAPAGTVVLWAVPDRERDVSTVSQDGVFTARIVGIYRVYAIATVNGVELAHAVARVTVQGIDPPAAQ